MVLLDQFGEFFAKIFRPVNADIGLTFQMKDTSGTLRTMRVYGNFPDDPMFESQGVSQFQVGKGVSVVARTDFKIESPFTNGGVEDNPVTGLLGVFDQGLGLITIAGQIPSAFGAGSITEVVKINNWRAIDNVVYPFAIFRDTISPVSFIATDAINVTHEVQV